jgi:hypothetical protein
MFEYRRVYATQPENGMVLTDFQVKICQKFLSHPLINPKKASTFTSGRQQTHLYNCQFQRIPTNSPVNRFLDIFPSSIFPTGPVAALILVIAGTHLSSGSSGCSAPLPSRPTPFNPLVNQNVPYSNGRCLYPIPTSSPPPTVGGPNPIPTITTHRTCLRSRLHHLLFLLSQELQGFIQLSALGGFL